MDLPPEGEGDEDNGEGACLLSDDSTASTLSPGGDPHGLKHRQFANITFSGQARSGFESLFESCTSE